MLIKTNDLGFVPSKTQIKLGISQVKSDQSMMCSKWAKAFLVYIED